MTHERQSEEIIRLIKALDAEKPDWWIRFASEHTFRHLSYAIKNKDFDRALREMESRKYSIAQDLFVVLRAGYSAGLVREP